PYLHDGPQSFPTPELPYPVSRRLVLRDGRWQLDNGYCRNTILVSYFTGATPPRTADCKPNEVEVPSVLGMSFDRAKARLSEQPLEAQVIYKPAAPGQRVGVVLAEIPGIGARLSSFDTVRLVLAKPVHGVLPRVVGLPLAKAKQRLSKLGTR